MTRAGYFATPANAMPSPISSSSPSMVPRDEIISVNAVTVFSASPTLWPITWSASTDGPANVVCEEISFAHGAGPRRLVLATLGRGIWTAQVTLPTAAPYGSACAGHASPPLLGVDAQAPARLGTTMRVVGSNLVPAPVAWLLLGTSDTTWNGTPLPLPLDALGLVGCTLQTSVEASPGSAVSASGGATWDLALPAGAAFLGVSVYGQILAIELGANPANLVTSRPLHVTTGW